MKALAWSTGLALALCGGLALSGCSDSNASPTSASASAPAPGQYVAFVGELKSMSGGNLKVGRDDVVANSSTLVFRNNVAIAIRDLRIGEMVRVKGWFNDTATQIVARQIIVESEG